jgi:hypothetical protein
MKVNELIEILKTFPQELEVFGPSDDSDFDYQPVMKASIINSTIIDEESDNEPLPIDICAIEVRE